MSAPRPPQFAVVTDGGMDAFADLNNAVPVAPFGLTFGSVSYRMHDLTREQLYQELQTNPAHPTSSQPTLQDWSEALREVGTAGAAQVLALTISQGLSGSINAAQQVLGLYPALDVTLHDSRTLSAAQAFQVHAAATAAARGESLETALAWVRAVAEETELYFTIETLDYLRRGGRIGRVQATLGGLLNLKPVITVEDGIYTTVARGRSYRGGLEALATQVTRRYGEGTPLRLGLLYGSVPADADELLAMIEQRHPVVWAGKAGVNPVLNVHTGPRACGVAAAPGAWPWER
ncbi:DegV family protein [Deinococcus petrolearius]|uniref:DegV family protein n=1 Tax=Deinococcus petrolearius TaxID=1751295 RepID=A0ABW1DI87_9DEIO